MSDIKVRRDGPVTRITIDRPAKSNALSADMMQEVTAIVNLSLIHI